MLEFELGTIKELTSNIHNVGKVKRSSSSVLKLLGGPRRMRFFFSFFF
jgi:hypothetical protein